MAERGVSWENMENTKNEEKMQDINEMTLNTLFMIQNTLFVCQNTLFDNQMSLNTLLSPFENMILGHLEI